MRRPPPRVNESLDIGELYPLLLAGAGEVPVMKNRIVRGTVTRIDLIRLWGKKR